MVNSKESANIDRGRFNPNFVQIGVIMDNRDPHRMGSLKVWIEGSQSEKDDQSSWITALYAPIFVGSTGGDPSTGKYTDYPKSYGLWMVPPDVGGRVGIFFKNGHEAEAYWFCCIPDHGMNTMIPGAAMSNIEGTGYDMDTPIIEYNRNNQFSSTNDYYMNSPLIASLAKQNLLYDTTGKGAANRSSTRTTVPHVLGINSQRNNAIIIDDGYRDDELSEESWDETQSPQNTNWQNPANDTTIGSRKNEGIILRTRSGSQIILSESDGFVFIINRDGTARVELTPDGEVYVVSDRSISMRTSEDFNLSIARDFNVDVGGNYNMVVNGESKINLLGNTDLKINSNFVGNVLGEFRLSVGGTTRIQSNADINMSSATETNVTSTGNMNIISNAELLATSKGSMQINSSSDVNMSASSTISGKASEIVLSGGGSHLTVGDGNVSSNVNMTGTNFVTPSVDLNNHYHKIEDWTNAENHSNSTSPPLGGGDKGTPKTAPDAEQAQPAQPANDIVAEIPVQNEFEIVNGGISLTEEMDNTLEQDMNKGFGTYDAETGGYTVTDGNSSSGISYKTSNEMMGFIMPTTGVISEYGYYGRNVDNGKGAKEDRYYWLIQSTSDVYADYGGEAQVENGNVVIHHDNGYRSYYYNIETSLIARGNVSTGMKLGKAKGLLKYVIRTDTSNPTAYFGSVDPGMFYASVTGVGKSASGMSLIGGKPSVERPPASQNTKPSRNSTDLVSISTQKGSVSSMPNRGSKSSPNKKSVKTHRDPVTNMLIADDPATFFGINEDLTKTDKTPLDWKVSPTEPQMIEEIKILEGGTNTKYFQNGKFVVYMDTLGFPTIGHGHLLRKKTDDWMKMGITEQQANDLLISDLAIHIKEAQKIYRENDLHCPFLIQICLAQMVYAIGGGSSSAGSGVRGYKNMLRALKMQDYKAAAAHFRDSTWWRVQARNRAEFYARRIESCA